MVGERLHTRDVTPVAGCGWGCCSAENKPGLVAVCIACAHEGALVETQVARRLVNDEGGGGATGLIRQITVGSRRDLNILTS